MNKNHKVGLYIADINETEYDYEFWYNSMIPARAERCDRFRFDEDKKRCVLAWTLLMYCLSAFENGNRISDFTDSRSDNSQLPVKMGRIVNIPSALDETLTRYLENYRVSEKGKPYIENGKIRFNLSHSGSRVICAVSENEVGCDVEKKTGDCLKIAQRFFAPQEYDFLSKITQEEQLEKEFLKLWTMKEAFVKANGMGIAYPFSEVSFVDEKGFYCNRVEDLDGNKYFIENIDMNDEYSYSICVSENSKIG